MLAEHLKQAVILVGVHRLNVRFHFDGATRELQLSAHLLADTHIQFRDMNVIHQFRIFGDGSLQIFFRRTVNVIVPLHADTIDRHTCLLHLLHHIVDAVALARIGSIIIVVEELDSRIRLPGKLERFGNKLIAAQLIQLGFAIRIRLLSATSKPAVRYGLIHHIPAIHHIRIALHHRMDIFLKTLVENFLAYRLAFLIGKHPVGKLRMPNQAVPAHLQPIGTAEVGNAVCSTPMPHILSRMDGRRLHLVFASHAVKLAEHHQLLFRRQIPHIQGNTHLEIIPVCILQALRLRSCGMFLPEQHRTKDSD